MSGGPSLFVLDKAHARLSKKRNPLMQIEKSVDFERFRPTVDAALARSDRSKGGRPPFDSVLMFKVLVIQTLYGLSDDQTEYELLDRLTFRRFLGLELDDRTPDAKTVWHFRERLTKAGAVRRLFADFEARLAAAGYMARSGQMIDATLVAAPKPRNTKSEKAALKEGQIPEDWQAKPHKLAQKDRDGRWTLQRGGGRDGDPILVPFFGYKNHVGIDRGHKLIRSYEVTDAATYDGGQFPALVDRSNAGRLVWADTAYRSKDNEAFLNRFGLKSRVHFRKPPGKPMPERQRQANRARSRVRAHVEHVFAHQKRFLDLSVRSIGISRARTRIGLINLVYNMRRLAHLEAQATAA